MNHPVSIAQRSDCEATLVCPTCRAAQIWSNECRRCKSDLRDLHAVWQASERERRACLRALRSGDLERALQHARTYHSFDPGDDANRLLTVCHLHRGDWLLACKLQMRRQSS